jgi:TonB family protein
MSPAIPPATLALIRDDVSLKVAIEIDSEGKVLSASPVGANGSLEKLLAPHAIQAARLWRFNPAQRDGGAVESQMIVTFHFSRR